MMDELPRVREGLVQRELPVRRETLVGHVKSLTRDDAAANNDEAAIITVAAEVSGKTLRVQVPLTGENHGWAIMAYRRQLPFTVTGDLTYERRAWRLMGNIEVDSSFLRHLSGSSTPDLSEE